MCSKRSRSTLRSAILAEAGYFLLCKNDPAGTSGRNKAKHVLPFRLHTVPHYNFEQFRVVEYKQMRTGRDSWIRIINSFLMAHVHLPQPCTTLHNLTVMRQESVVQTAFSTPCVEASLASKASLHRDFNVEVLPADTCQWHMPVSCFHAEICWDMLSQWCNDPPFDPQLIT